MKNNKLIRNIKNIFAIKSVWILLITIAISLLLYIKFNNQTFYKTSSKEQSFLLKTIKGETFIINASSNYFKIPKIKNKVIFIKVFGWDCKYCQKEIPELISLKKQFNEVFDVIAIESQHHTTKENQQYAKDKHINYHIVTGKKYQNFFQYLKTYYKWNNTIPLTIVIGENGMVLAFEIGSKSYHLAELLKVSLQQQKLIYDLQKINKE